MNNLNKSENKTYIKSPLNYTGGKYKLLPSILPLFPVKEDIDIFIDLFGGGFNVGINTDYNKIVYIDNCFEVVRLLIFIRTWDEDFNNTIKHMTEKYNLQYKNEESKIGYEKLKEKYNNSFLDSFFESIVFYTLITSSFSNQIRFNKDGKFNMPYGKRYYNPSMQKNMIEFSKALKNKNIAFLHYDYTYIIELVDEYIANGIDPSRIFVYIDPPYLGSVATYCEQGKWNEKNETNLLYNVLNMLSTKNIKWGLSNNLKYGNIILEDWLKNARSIEKINTETNKIERKELNIYDLNRDYSTCNYQKKNKSKDKEIFIANY